MQIIGYILSGLFIKNLPLALVVSLAWNVLLWVAIIIPAATREQSSPKMGIFLMSCIVAVFVTGATYFFASRWRRLLPVEQKTDKENKVQEKQAPLPSGAELEKLRRHYQQLDNDKIIELLQNGEGDFVAGGYVVLKEEAAKRGLVTGQAE